MESTMEPEESGKSGKSWAWPESQWMEEEDEKRISWGLQVGLVRGVKGNMMLT